MNILLLGCTGFFGKGIIYYLLNNTEYNIVLALRSKNKVSINERINKILDELHLKDTDKRIKLIKVEYDNLRNIIISKKDKEFLKKNIDIVLNGLADIKFNRVLKKAVLNNTITALNWMSFFQDCIRTKKYIYVSTAFVNFHLKNTGQISEKIYEQSMTDNTLTEILNGKITSIKPYNNTYLYSKQLTEILLFNRKNHISLSIFRPSVITPAVTYPYSGWANIQTFSFQMFAIGTGILPCWNVSMKHIFHNNINIIPVDIAAKDCILMIDDNKDFNVKHSCLTGNNKYYDEINFIGHVYWGWELPDISLYRDQLITDYIKTQSVWSKIKHQYNRTASLGTQFRLYVHLKAIGYECNRDDFKIQDMVESLRLHNEAWKIMCDETGVKYYFVS